MAPNKTVKNRTGGPSFVSKIWNSIYFRLSVMTLCYFPLFWSFNLILDKFEEGKFGEVVSIFVAIPIMVIVFLLAVWSLPPNLNNKVNKAYYYSFVVVLFGTIADWMLMLEYEGIIKGHLGQYLKKGEPYLDSPYGSIVCMIDAFIFLPMHLYFIIQTTKGESYRRLSIYWFGAVMNSMIVILTSAFHHGPTGTTLLNIHWVVFPTIVFIKSWNETPKYKVNVINTKPILKRLTDLSFVVFLILYILLATIRAIASKGSDTFLAVAYRNFDKTIVLDKPAPFIPIQIDVNYYYGALVCVAIIVGLLGRGYERLGDLSLLFAGAAMESQIMHMVVQTHGQTPEQFRIDPLSPQISTLYHWIIGLGLLVVPHLIALRFHCVSSRSLTKSNKRS